MTQKDLELISQAERINPINHMDIDAMVEQAETADAKETLIGIEKRKAREEKWSLDYADFYDDRDDFYGYE